MHLVTRGLRALGVGSLAVGLLGAITPTAEAAPSPEASDPVVEREWTRITLLTGDQVLVDDDDPHRATVLPAPGRTGTSFHRHIIGNHLYVLPSDVLPQVASGTLDRKLFDVTGLIEAEYDDDTTSRIPLIVRYRGAAARSSLTSAGAEPGQSLPVVDAAQFDVDKDVAEGFLEELPKTDDGFGGGIERIWLNGRVKVALDQSVPQIGAPAAWDAGYTGAGTTVAVLDTGIDASHPDLVGKVALDKDFTGEGPGDLFGHGTHVASIIAGSGEASGGRFRGVAPDATLLDGKVCDGSGWCYDDAIIAGLEWAALEQGADVINLSLGAPDGPDIDPLEEAVNVLSETTGAVIVAAAGNDGPRTGSVSTPASADAALAVGAVDSSDEIAWFSSRGPRIGDGAVKPDVTAPGVAVVAARASGTTLDIPIDERYVAASGTSMATPHVAGAAALLAQQHPAWDGEVIKAALVASARSNPQLSAFEQGAGRIELTRAIEQSVVVEPVSLSFGTASWPHDDDQPVTRELTYRNLGTQDVTLDMTAELTGPDGMPAPANALTVNEPSVTVPAGGTAVVIVTSDTAHDGPNGHYSGRVVASAGDVSVTTALAVDREGERYDLTLQSLDRGGDPAPVLALVVGLDSEVDELVLDGTGIATRRLPKGRYVVLSQVIEADADEISVLVQPVLDLTSDLTWTADARQAKRISVQVQDRRVTPTLLEIGGSVSTDEWFVGSSLAAGGGTALYTAQVGSTPPDVTVHATVGAEFAVPGRDGQFHNSPVIYRVLDEQTGRFWTGYRRTFRDAELATIKQQLNAYDPGRTGWVYAAGYTPNSGGGTATLFDFDLPASTTLRLAVGRDIYWSQGFTEMSSDTWVADLRSPGDGTYRKGRTYTERWNAAPVRPIDAHGDRYSDELYFTTDLFSDQDGHLGYSAVDAAETVLYRDGEVIAREEWDGYIWAAGLPPESATYRIETTAERPSTSGLSTRQTAAWSFRSAAPPEDGVAALPLWAALLQPRVDSRNRTSGAVVEVPLTVRAVEGAPVGRIKTVSVNVSTDDGQTWRKAPVKAERVRATGKGARHGTGKAAGRYIVTVKQPKGTKFVSLQVAVTDTEGNTFDQTTIRAWAVR